MNKKLSEEIAGLRSHLKSCRKELHREKQKNKDLRQSREKYRARAKEPGNRLQAEELLKKNAESPISINRLLKDINIVTSR
jgi:chromosome segregation ATPase